MRICFDQYWRHSTSSLTRVLQILNCPVGVLLVHFCLLITTLVDANSPTQTSAASSVDPEVLGRIEANFLQQLGLSRRPRPKRKISVPKAMWDEYAEVSGFDPRKRPKPTGALPYDTVRTFRPEIPSCGESSSVNTILTAVEFEQNLQNFRL